MRTAKRFAGNFVLVHVFVLAVLVLGVTSISNALQASAPSFATRGTEGYDEYQVMNRGNELREFWVTMPLGQRAERAL